MFVLANMWFQTLMRQFFFNIDRIVFNFISTIYDFLITIARTSVISQADIIDMADRIYKLLALFMIFKVTFSLIMYVVNPDDFSDKSKGVSKLGTNIVISLSLLILTPYIFNYAYQIQTIILEDNSMAALIFGEDIQNSTSSPFESAGDSMAFITMSPFFVPNSAIDALSECSQLTLKNSSGEIVFNEECSGLDENYASTNDSKSLMALTNDKFSEQTLKNYVAGVSTGNLGIMFRQDMAVATSEDNSEYIIEYKYLFSTVLGIVVILLLVTFCLDVALRSVKLAFLQLVAPIPIISYVDPKSGKDGMFKKWYEMCFKTYISLFIRLLAIYFAAYIISRVDKMVDIVDGSYVSNLLVKIFIIIGALMFAKQLPKILEGLGIKLDGGFTLNPLKKIENEMIGGKQVAKVGRAGLKYGGRLAKGAGTAALVGGAAAVTGQGFRGGGKAFMGAMKGEKFGKNFSNSYNAARERNKEVARMRNDGVDPWDVKKENFLNKFRSMTPKDRLDDFNASVQKIQDNNKSYYNGVLGADKLAKEFERRRLAAENAGDHVGMQLWQDCIDNRVAEIEANGGNIMLTDKDNVAAKIAANIEATTGSKYGDSAIGSVSNASNNAAVKVGVSADNVKLETSQGLVDIRNNTSKVVTYINDNYDGKFGYTKGKLSTSDNMKTVTGISKGVQLDASVNPEAVDIEKQAKYMSQSSKK